MLLPTNKNWLYLNNSLQISCNPTSWIRLLVRILVFISCHRKSKRILENIFCPRSILSSPNTLFPQNIPFSNKLQGSTILYLIISIDETNNCLQIFPVNLATITGNLPFCDISQKFFGNCPPTEFFLWNPNSHRIFFENPSAKSYLLNWCIFWRQKTPKMRDILTKNNLFHFQHHTQ